ncbi:MAG: Zn-ribbon domain-containing OB-fold protein [Candidatus Binatia bacterium]
MKTETQAAPARLPILHGYTKEFYDWCQKGELRFQRCQRCSTWRHPPRPMCGSCHSLDWEWAPTKGKGKVYSWTTVHQALDPAFATAVPYAAVIVELDEGPRLATWVTDISPDELRIGMPVEVWFDQVSDEVTLPKFKRLR